MPFLTVFTHLDHRGEGAMPVVNITGGNMGGLGGWKGGMEMIEGGYKHQSI